MAALAGLSRHPLPYSFPTGTQMMHTRPQPLPFASSPCIFTPSAAPPAAPLPQNYGSLASLRQVVEMVVRTPVASLVDLQAAHAATWDRWGDAAGSRGVRWC